MTSLDVEPGESARSRGRPLVERYRRYRQCTRAHGASLGSGGGAAAADGQAIGAPNSVVGEISAAATGAVGSTVASRGIRKEQRLLSSITNALGGGRRGSGGGGASGAALVFNELKFRKKKLKFAKSPIHAWGLYALEAIEREEFVVEYIGEYVRNCVAETRQRDYERLGLGDDYIFRVDTETLVDATRKGGLARFANHCCDPNCYTRIIRAGGMPRIVLYTKRAVGVGEEITYDYKFDRDENEEVRITCHCGAKKCSGFLN